MMVTTLLSLAGALLQQIWVTLLLPVTLFLSSAGVEGVSPSLYHSTVARAVTMTKSYSDEVWGVVEASSLPPASVQTEDEGGAAPASHTRRMARNIGNRIDSLVNSTVPEMSTDSLLNVVIGPPVPDRTDKSAVVDKINSTISSADVDWDYDEVEEIAMVVTLIITIVCFGIPFLAMIVIIGLILNSRMKYQRERLRVIEKIASSGHEIPSVLAPGERMSPYERRSRLKSALQWLAVGFCLLVFFTGVTRSSMAIVTFGLVPLTVGIVKLALFFYDSRNSDDTECETKVFPPQFTGLDNDLDKEHPKTPVRDDEYYRRYQPREWSDTDGGSTDGKPDHER